MGAIDRYRAPALDKGLDILELLSEQKEGLTRTEITKELGRNASEIYRMLERLVARRYVMRSTGGDRYTLSLKLFSLAHRHPPMSRLIAEALPPMQRFADSSEQSCHLSVYDRGNLLVIAQVDGPGPWGCRSGSARASGSPIRHRGGSCCRSRAPSSARTCSRSTARSRAKRR
ncbi:sugar-specific transcriptional regulator TrmB family protein [Burkholderia cepacia]|nr:sugar-specific transcriptional regulator TrmB family protein [Burkholderia cepacia]